MTTLSLTPEPPTVTHGVTIDDGSVPLSWSVQYRARATLSTGQCVRVEYNVDEDGRFGPSFFMNVEPAPGEESDTSLRVYNAPTPATIESTGFSREVLAAIATSITAVLADEDAHGPRLMRQARSVHAAYARLHPDDPNGERDNSPELPESAAPEASVKEEYHDPYDDGEPDDCCGEGWKRPTA
jgi:hypothetical protein